MSMASETNNLVLRMFVATADQNYILPRLAYLNGLSLDFFWLSLHATEKYLKAILLFNGHSTRSFRHDLVKLYSQVQKLYPKLVLGPLVDPKLEHLHWRDCSVEDFLARLGSCGHPSNRYLTYGYTAMLSDLVKVDQLVWSVRRYCRPLRETLEGHEIDHIEELRKHPESWTLGGFLPLEELMEGTRGEGLKNTFLLGNTSFAPDVRHSITPRLHLRVDNPLFTKYFNSLSVRTHNTV